MLEGTGLSNSVLACGVVLAELGTVQRFLAVCSSTQAVNLKSEFFPECATVCWLFHTLEVVLCQRSGTLSAKDGLVDISGNPTPIFCDRQYHRSGFWP